METYYIRLGIGSDASQEEIEAAYRHQQERYDPERVADMDQDLYRLATQRRADLDEAYRVLSDPDQRRQYDQRLAHQLANQEGDSGGQPSKPDGSDGSDGSDESGLSDLSDDTTYERRDSAPTKSPEGRHTPQWWYVVGGVLLALVVVLISWSWNGERESTPTALSVPEVNRPAPAFTLPSAGEEEVHLEDYRGKVVLVNFWGSWCPPCINELPALQTAYEQLQDEGFVIIGVNLFHQEQASQRTKEDIRQFLDDQNITYPVALDVEGDVTDAYRVLPIPTSFFIDAEGNIRYVLPRELTTNEITELFATLKQETTALQE